MEGFRVIAGDRIIRFRYYLEEAPVTSRAFAALLPFSRIFYHARVSGQEIWIDDVPPLAIIQENASIFTVPGEVVFGPSRPVRTRTANCMGIYYGDGRGLDACNIFAKVWDEDLELLRELGQSIWEHGKQRITFETLTEQ